MDDLVTGAEDEDQAYEEFTKSKEILKDGGFNLQNFSSNSMLLQARVDGDKDTQAVNPPQGSPHVLESEETYSSATLAPDSKCT